MMGTAMTTRIIYSFRREDYDAIIALVTDYDWPATFDQWAEGVVQERSKLDARGKSVVETIIDPQQFLAYCRASGMDHNHTTLGAFAVKVARHQAERGAKGAG